MDIISLKYNGETFHVIQETYPVVGEMYFFKSPFDEYELGMYQEDIEGKLHFITQYGGSIVDRDNCYRYYETGDHPHFRKGRVDDLKEGQLYIVRYSSYNTDITCVRAGMRYGIHFLSRVKYIESEKNRIVFGPKGSTEFYRGVLITDTLIPTNQQVIDDFLLWEKLHKEEQDKTPLDYSCGVSADQECDWSYDIDKRVYNRFRNIKNKKLGRTDIKISDVSVGDKFKCTREVVNICGDLFFDVGGTYEVIKVNKNKGLIEMNVLFSEVGVNLSVDRNVEIRITTLNDDFKIIL